VLWRPENSILAPVETLKPPESNSRFGPPCVPGRDRASSSYSMHLGNGVQCGVHTALVTSAFVIR
jgi:hypothetical protein